MYPWRLPKEQRMFFYALAGGIVLMVAFVGMELCFWLAYATWYSLAAGGVFVFMTRWFIRMYRRHYRFVLKWNADMDHFRTRAEELRRRMQAPFN